MINKFRDRYIDIIVTLFLTGIVKFSKVENYDASIQHLLFSIASFCLS